MPRPPRSSVPLVLLLVVLVLLGLATNAIVFFEPPWLHGFRKPMAGIASEAARGRSGELPPSEAEGFRQAVYLLEIARCDGQGYSTGTGFLIDEGFVITCSHVVGDNLSCASPIRMVDSEGNDQVASLEAYSNPDDVALLRLTHTRASPLRLAASAQYQDSDQPLRVFTIGYPLVGAASSAERASFSGVGTVSQFDSTQKVFITSGLNINPGNSGGPVVFEGQRLVLGMACSRLDSRVADGIGYVIPSDRLRSFFASKTGRSLP